MKNNGYQELLQKSYPAMDHTMQQLHQRASTGDTSILSHPLASNVQNLPTHGGGTFSTSPMATLADSIGNPKSVSKPHEIVSKLLQHPDVGKVPHGDGETILHRLSNHRMVNTPEMHNMIFKPTNEIII